MALADAVRYFTEETHILSSMAIVCGNRTRSVTELGGAADLAGTAVNRDTIYDLASLTKLFTSLLCCRLSEEGLLDLNASVTRYSPRFIHLQDVTVDQVLGFELALVSPQRVDAQPDALQAQRMLEQVQPRENGWGRAYSDMHAMVIKCVIEGAAQQAYMELLHSRILDPLGMTHTWSRVPDELLPRCASFDREHRIERGRYILRDGIAKGVPHDPKARIIRGDGCDCAGHAGLFATLDDVRLLAQGVLNERIVSDAMLASMARNRTGRPTPDGGWTQFLGSLCYVKHPNLYFSEIPLYESDRAIGLSGFTGHHLSIDPGNGVFACYLGNRVLNRLSTLLPEDGRSITDYGLDENGRGEVLWPDGSRVWSSVNYVHQKDAHFHNEVAKVLAEL